MAQTLCPVSLSVCALHVPNSDPFSLYIFFSFLFISFQPYTDTPSTPSIAASIFSVPLLNYNRAEMENEANSPSSICLENSEWLAENIKGLDQTVKEMLVLVENDGSFSVEKLGDDELMQPKLIARVKEISHRYHLLADHYRKLTGRLSCYEKSNSLLGLPFLTPEKKLGMQNDKAQVVSSDLSLSSGGGISDTTPVEGSDSSLLSSDSDSESYNLSPSGKMLKHDIVNVGTEAALTYQENSYEIIKGGQYELLVRLSDYEKELKVSKEKLLFAEEEIAKLKNQLLENEAFAIKMGSMQAQLVSAENQIKLQDADIEKENQKSLMLQWQVVDLETKLESEKRQIDELQESVNNYSVELSDRDLLIQKLNADLQDVSGSFALEKWQLESSVSKLSECLTYHEERANELQKQCESLEAEKFKIVRTQEAQQIIWRDNLECVKMELSEKKSLVDTLNKNLDELKLNYDTMMAEKDGVDATLQTLNTDISVREEHIQRLEGILLELQSEKEQLRAGADSASKITAEMKSRIVELEKEVGMQTVMISDIAEEKREAIRQLCFSLDNFRSAYQELRKEYATRKRPAAIAS
ncbi:hypothetical protein C2S52_016068 [Perilla frutescens var. hirtella]|nr:hypothetical protein C2S52_016068 [Perilla frutescens var. hirtella]